MEDELSNSTKNGILYLEDEMDKVFCIPSRNFIFLTEEFFKVVRARAGKSIGPQDHWSQKNFEFPENISQERIKL